MTSIRTLKTLIAVAETGSFAAAAQRVALTPAAVGVQMKALEDELGRALFTREARGAVLAPAAHTVLLHARRLIAQYEDMVSARDDQLQIAGSFVVGSITSAVALLAGSVVELKALHPALDITLIHGRQADLRNKVLSGEMDAAIFVETGGQRAPEMDWHPLYTEPLMLVCSSRLPSSADARQLLNEQPMIRFDHTGSTGPKIEQILRHSRVQPKVILEMNSVTSIVELVRKNLGVSIVPLLHGFGWERDPALRLLSLPGRQYERGVGMLANTQRAHITGVLFKQLLRQIDVDAQCR
ncbi:LysR family transcriptional regulator [Hydrogenophaga sp. 2FB]|uniref:LysR family transcriptional regulator n=1 Tax=Hydrogenophaga sp. 2FB TaxID=2502187 RepID=UPI0010F93E39|nr:LysR family transcriptional regulator [Hydrogenophaga sp. 2FB]